MVPFCSNLAGALTVLLLFPSLSQSKAEGFVSEWLKAQTNLTAWTADFIQTRSLKALTEPLTSTGKVWFAAPNRFRWELGNPAETIALRTETDLWVVYPKLKRAEKYSMSGQLGPWKDALALLEAGFPRSEHELNQRFKILEQKSVEGRVQLRLQPKSAQARKMMPEMLLVVDEKKLQLAATELQFADGSRLRNDFTNTIENPLIPTSFFQPPSAADIKIVEPLKR